METHSAQPIIADLFLNCFELQFMNNISKDPPKEHIIQKIYNTLRYLGDIFVLNNDNFPALKTFILLNCL